jgi:signal peptidase II
VLIIGIIFLYAREEFQKNSKIIDIGYVLILSGGLSHAYERIFIGHVVDFIAVKYFAILNFADIFISIGAFLIIFFYVYSHRGS